MTALRSSLAAVVVLTALASACAPFLRPEGAIRFVASPSFDERRPNLVVLHHTSNDTAEQALATLTDPARKVSAHYLVSRDGRIVHLVDERARAWHAGKSWWGGITDINSISIGIELDNNGTEPFPDAQIDALLPLLAGLQQRHRIPPANVIGHGDVAPGRKSDPSAAFPWPRLAEAGFGLWCDPPWPPAPGGSELSLLLAALGYDPAVPEASAQAFRLHFAAGKPLDDADARALAACLLARRTRMPPA